MVGARGDALDWALALARAPGERHALRQRPLPDGIEPLLQIAVGGHGGALQAAMARTGEDEAELLEAVRFYLREVLFHGSADAYRMLGLAPGASSAQIKTHHRLLQQWLHPDRQTSDWDAIFAGRVNAAWNALRTPERRAAYDATHPAAQAVAPAPTRWVAAPLGAPVPPPAETPAARWRQRAPLMALFAACGVLGIAAVRDALREPDTGAAYSAQAGQSRADSAADAIALRLPDTPGAAAAGRVATPARGRAAAETAAARARPRTPSPPPQKATAPTLPTPIPTVAMPPPLPANTRAVPMPSPVRDVAVAAAPPLQAAVAALALSPPTASDPAVPAPSAPRVASTPTAPAGGSIDAPPAAMPPVSATSPERVQQAQRTGSQLIAFLSGHSRAIPPIWDSLTAQQRAVRLRESLQAGGATRAGEPQWRVAGEDASLRTGFGDRAQVRAQLVWRDQRWLVSGVALEQSP